jgi:hypothetical protein
MISIGLNDKFTYNHPLPTPMEIDTILTDSANMYIPIGKDVFVCLTDFCEISPPAYVGGRDDAGSEKCTFRIADCPIRSSK